MEAGVALQAELAAFTANEKVDVGCAMGIMASGAACDADRGMFEDEGAVFFDVAICAGLIPGASEAGEIEGFMRIVAVGAF